MKAPLLLCTLMLPVLFPSMPGAKPYTVKTVAVHPIPGTGRVVWEGRCVIPRDETLRLAKRPAAGGLHELHMIGPAPRRPEKSAVRMNAVRQKSRSRRGHYAIQSLYYALRDYAKKHENVGPESIDDLNLTGDHHMKSMVTQTPWPGEAGTGQGPYVFIIPRVPFGAEDASSAAGDRKILALELRPYLNDGKHRVLYTDGTVERLPYQTDLLDRFGRTVVPITAPPAQAEPEPPPGEKVFVAVWEKDAGDALRFRLENPAGGKPIPVVWPVAADAPEDKSALERWKTARIRKWMPYALNPSGGIVRSWLLASGEKVPDLRRGPRREGRQTTVFGLLGGRAAVRETLQMQEIQVSETPGVKAEIPLNTLSGVTVTSHPYAEMLSGDPANPILPANLIPPDRLFVHVRQPDSLLSFLDRGTGFIAGAGSAITGNSIAYDLKHRYLSRLGLSEKTVRPLLESGVVSEIGLFFPDLFFIDGTEVTAVCRVAGGKTLAALLPFFGFAATSGETIGKRKLPGGDFVYHAAVGGFFLLSTSKQELETALSLHSREGAGSLGKSDEFRYMTGRLPESGKTRMYVYFSDPFIRRLTGPGVKIAQYRRMKARARMEHLTALVLLARLDGVIGKISTDQLVSLGYTKAVPADLRIDENDIVVSETYGRLSHLTPLSRVPLDRVTRDEANAYQTYVDNYTRFWREFFDPIAVRLDDEEEKRLSVTVFILPLVDSSIYRGIREVLIKAEDPTPLKIPVLTPTPPVSLSLNLAERSWRQITEFLHEVFSSFTHLHPGILDDLGPGLHLVIHDADPVIALGSGDLLGMFRTAPFFRGPPGLFAPIAASILTRPCALWVETKNPRKTTGHLQQANHITPRLERGFTSEIYRIDDENEWVYSIDIMGFIKLRYGISVDGDYLVIRNIPWHKRQTPVGITTAPLNGARISTHPVSTQKQLPGLFTAWAEGRRKAALGSAARLYPIIAALDASPEAAAAIHARRFGFTPQHPNPGNWVWEEGHIASSAFGSLLSQKQPSFSSADEEFGLFQNIQEAGLSMQFESEGLRSRVIWKSEPGP